MAGFEPLPLTLPYDELGPATTRDAADSRPFLNTQTGHPAISTLRDRGCNDEAHIPPVIYSRDGDGYALFLYIHQSDDIAALPSRLLGGECEALIPTRWRCGKPLHGPVMVDPSLVLMSPSVGVPW